MSTATLDPDYVASDVLDGEPVGGFKVVREETLTASAFLMLLQRDPSAIKHVKVVPPALGDRRRAGLFGTFMVEYATSRLRKR